MNTIRVISSMYTLAITRNGMNIIQVHQEKHFSLFFFSFIFLFFLFLSDLVRTTWYLRFNNPRQTLTAQNNNNPIFLCNPWL